MSSGTNVSAEAQRLAALKEFPYKRNAAQQLNSQQSSNSFSSASNSSSSSLGPPTQSRDATIRSRYYTSQPQNGTVLVPNSSPVSLESKYQSYRPYQHAQSTQTVQGFTHHSSWSQGGLSRSDPLSRPSGFVASHASNNVNNARFVPPSTPRRMDEDDGSDNERPRKRANVAQTSSTSLDAGDLHSPTSPEILRPGQKRTFPSNKLATMSTPPSSDESLIDTHSTATGPPKSRLVRGHRPPKEEDDPALTKFLTVNAWMDRKDVTAAYHYCKGDIKEATKLLLNSNFSAASLRTEASSSSPPATVTLPNPHIVGKVKEVDEEREAARAAAREMAAKSSIYKKRANLDVSTTTSVTPKTPAPIEMNSSPVQIRAPRAKAKKRIVDSGSEVESDSGGHVRRPDVHREGYYERKAMDSLNTFGLESLRELTGCTHEQADKIISLRPFGSVDDLRHRLQQGKKKAGPAGISPRMFEDCVSIYEGYGSVDRILEDCERIGHDLKKAIAGWSGKAKGKQRDGSMASRSPSILDDDVADDGALNLVSLSNNYGGNGFITKPPSLLAPDVQLKDYQLIGINWLQLLHSRNLSCILADEMGLGKTVQVISFFAYLKEKGHNGPHLIVVPSSTLENWCREFERFAPSISIQTYYAGKEDRARLRETLLDTCVGKRNKNGSCWEVLITTYTLAVGDERDRKFLRKINWNTCVFDEGHILKNFQSQRYTALTRIRSQWKLLLTGTPLQNNLQELVSLMNFILPDQFEDELENLRAIFKVKGDSKVSLLAEERVSRAKRMMTPFVLRRRKDQVLKDLPLKTERIEWCELTPLQKTIYSDARQRSRKTVYDVVGLDGRQTTVNGIDTAPANNPAKSQPKKGRGNPRTKEKMYLENSSNVLMDLRKAASHPMLFRTQFTDSTLACIARLLLKEPDFKKRGALFDYVKEDMEVMTDAELQAFCRTYKSTQKYLLSDDAYLKAGKISVMLHLLERYMAEGRKCLIFSQFTQILDILQVVLKHRSIKHLVLTGSTPVDVRQGLVDEFTADSSIPVFLLSTRAGGMGINLTAASVVILFDQDFNPHNDRQAADRAYRIGQKRDVEIVKLISRGTIEEDMLRLGETKLALDEAVAGDGDGEVDPKAGESKAEKVMRASLMETLRKQFEEEDHKPSSEVKENGDLSSKRQSPLQKEDDAMIIDSDSSLTDLEDD